MLILSRKIDEKIKIGNDITITVIGVNGDQVKVGVEAPKNVKVFRQEVFEAIQQENKQAAASERPQRMEDMLKLLSTKLK
ncbi:MAG: carbon storage regulator CsrA [Treponema sp.]|nr:carbon storage regulator CsrA [Treponema sp.]